MAEKLLYVMAGYDEETEARLCGIQETLYARGFSGTQTRNIPQHITLGAFPTEREKELADLVKAVSEETAPFEVTFNHAGIFGGARVLFLAPDCGEALLRLKERFGTARGWTPHTTMLIDDPETVYRALPAVMETFSPFGGTVASLHLYEFFPSRRILSVRLSG